MAKANRVELIARVILQGTGSFLSPRIPHGRRKFVDAAPNFPDECLHVLTELSKVFHNDQITKEARMAPASA